MAGVKISALPAAPNSVLSDLLATVQTGVTKKETLQQVFNLMLANIILHFAGNPNGNVSGVVYQLCWDTTDEILWICTTSGTSGTAVWMNSSSSGGPFIFGVGTPSAVGGTSNTANGNFDLTYGQSSNSDNTTTHCFNFGFANTMDSSASYSVAFGNTVDNSCNYSFSFGNNTSIGIGADYSFCFGNECTVAASSGALYAFVFGDTCVADALSCVAWGNQAVANNVGSWVIGDSQQTPMADTTTDQFNATFAGGHKWAVGSSGSRTLAAQIDGSGNLINSLGRGDISYDISAPTTGATVTLSTTIFSTILNPAGTLATLIVQMPATPIDGQIQTVSTTQIISALTVDGNGHSVLGQPTSLIVGQSFTMIYDLDSTTWYPY
jgi:hypothetical protein